jgi:hypothetical protein
MAVQALPFSAPESDSKRFGAKELTMPIVGVDVMRQAFFRDAGATYARHFGLGLRSEVEKETEQ